MITRVQSICLATIGILALALSCLGWITLEFSVPKALNNVTAEAPITDRLSEPCLPGEDTRTSELCAQWKAADASWKSAEWTKYGVWGGLMTLSAAVAAAFYARQAAQAAISSGRLAEEQMIRSMRPWLSTKEPECYRILDEYCNVVGVYISFHWHNFGNSPAQRAILHMDYFIAQPEVESDTLPWIQVYDRINSASHLFPGQEGCSRSLEIDRTTYIKLNSRQIRLFVRSWSFYSDFYTGKRHKTVSGYEIFLHTPIDVVQTSAEKIPITCIFLDQFNIVD